MRFSTTAALALTSAIGVSALPLEKRQSGDIDADILQYALTVSALAL
jgi:hypothetical protein